MPLMIKLPGAAVTRTVGRRVPIELVMPTVLDLCGIDYRSSCYAAPSLAPLWSTATPPPAPELVLSSGAVVFEDKEAILFDGHKFIRSLTSGREELYDLESDPGETTTMLDTAVEVADRGRRLLQEQRRRFNEVHDCYRPASKAPLKQGPEVLKRLKSLGYIK